MFLQMQHFCFLDLGKEKLCSVLVFGNVCCNIVVRIKHDNVASRGAVGRTHTIVRLQTRIRRKDGTENFGSFVYVLDLYNGILCCGFLCARLISVSFPATTPRATTPHRSLFFRLPRRGLPRPTDIPRAITPRAITPLPPLHGYHACVYFPAMMP